MRWFKVTHKLRGPFFIPGEVAYRDILVTAENPEEAIQRVLDLEPEQYDEHTVQAVDTDVGDCFELVVER